MTRDVLVAAIERGLDRACNSLFQWGSDDCALWGADVIQDAFGFDPAAGYRGRYSDHEGAKKLLGPLGYGYALKRTAKENGWTRIDPTQAQTGDVGLILNEPLGIATVLCRAPGWFVGRGISGVSIVPAVNRAYPRLSVRLAWSVLP